MSNIAPKPSNVSWTDEQWQAIAAKDQNILVSAAAGSGKTAVLVERIIHRLTDKDDATDVDRLLVVTFTNAAAAEMRQRIGEALEKELAKDPGDLHLRRQLSLLNRASISTLHAFCINVLRTYYHQVSIDPGFRILDETEAALLRDEVLADLFEDYYSKENHEPFYQLVDVYSNDRSDVELQKLALRLYDFSQSHPWPDYWLADLANRYHVEDVKDIEDIPWVKTLLNNIQKQLYEAQRLLEEGLAITKVTGGPYPYAETLENDLAQVSHVVEAGNKWSSLYQAFQDLRFSRLNACRGDDIDGALKDEVKGLRDSAKTLLDSLHEDFFTRTPQEFLDELAAFAPIIDTLVELVNEFAVRFQKVKMEKAVLDFSDLEHYCLKVLMDENSSPDHVLPSAAAKDYQEQFTEVFVDEYQDTNFVQEAIIQLVTKDNNLFMVGDVKQSIYRFRLAEPTLFLEKYTRFSKSGNEHGLRIDLANNFRSRREVIDGTNFIFKQIMNETVGELHYDDNAMLKHGFDYPEAPDTETELLLIDQSDDEKKEESNETIEDANREQLEARLIARQIKQFTRNGQVFDKKLKTMRKATYRDFVILLRSTSNAAAAYLEELKQQGIPAYAEMSTGYFDATEVSVMMSLLKVIDNPDQDIPLAAVLRSPIVALSEEELANIRIVNQKASYFNAMKTYLQQNVPDGLFVKLERFYEKLVGWRTKARQGALSDLIWQLYRETGYYDFVAGMPGGLQRQANLRALYDRARQYEQTSFRGLFRFLRFIERMQDLGRDLGTARALGEQEDVVRLMTIHKSKGLEFPVVFVAGLSKQFNMQDLNVKVLLHKTLGLGTKFIDTKRRISYPTLLQQAIKQKMKSELLAEEMRVLYVALTRAREKLYLIATVKDAEKQIQKWQQHIRNKEWLLSDYERRKSKTYLDWIGPALIRHRDSQPFREYLQDKEVHSCDVYEHESKWKMSLIPAEELANMDERKMEEKEEKLQRIKNWQPVAEESEQKAEVYHQLQWTYPYQLLTEIKSKQTVTEMKRQREVLDEASERTYIQSFSNAISDRPKFLQKQKLSATERGTAMHTVMQHLPLIEGMTEETLQESLAELVNKEILTEEQAESVNTQWIMQFFESPLFDKVKMAMKTYREIPFSYSLSVNETNGVSDNPFHEKVVIQGVIDLIVENEDGLILIDYKTDVITDRFQGGFEEAKPTLLNRYRVQLELYEKAISDIWKKPVLEKYLYFFDGSRILKV